MNSFKTIEVSLPSYMLIKHLLSIEMGSWPVAFRASLAFLYSEAIATFSSAICSRLPVAGSTLEKVAFGVSPIFTLALLFVSFRVAP